MSIGKTSHWFLGTMYIFIKFALVEHLLNFEISSGSDTKCKNRRTWKKHPKKIIRSRKTRDMNPMFHAGK